MNDSDLHTWIQGWAGEYPAGDDDVLAPLKGVHELTRSHLAVIVKWKMEPHRRAGTLRSLDKESDKRIAALSQRAFACSDDLGALLILQQLTGIGPALASAILMAQNPTRYTVMDRWAVVALRWLEELPEDARAGSFVWLAYLQACRQISERTGESLRVLDRALYKGRGKPIPELAVGKPA